MKIPQKYKFIVQLGNLLHFYGVPSYKSEMFLTEIAWKKGISADIADTPTWINYVFHEEDEQTYNHIERVHPGELNLGGLAKSVEITNNLISDNIDFEDAGHALEELKNTPPSNGKIMEFLGFILAAGGFSIILDTSWTSVFAASIIGGIVYLITLLSAKSTYVRSTLEALVSFIATLIIGFASISFNQINVSMSILASIIVFIPGLSITTALEEITARHLVSGTTKLFDALVSLFKQFFGVVMGLAFLNLFAELPKEVVHNDIPPYLDYFAIIALATGISIVLKIRIKDIPFCVIVGFISYISTTLFSFSGLLISIFIGTIFTVVASRIFSKIRNTPRLVFLVPGIIMLVPGSKAFIGLSSVYLNQGSASGNMGEQILYILMGIIGGLMFTGTFMDKKLTKHNK